MKVRIRSPLLPKITRYHRPVNIENPVAAKNIGAMWATILTSTALFFFVSVLLFHAVPKESEAVVHELLGAVSCAWIGSMNYYFGSSRQSERQSELLAQSVPSHLIPKEPEEKKTI